MQSVNNQERVQPIGRLSHLIETILLSKGGYYADSLYTFERSVDKNVILQPIKHNPPPQLSWLILGREHYFETSKEYPIANQRDLKKALKFEDDKAPFSGVTLQYIQRLNEQSHRVTFWVYKPSALDILASQPWVVIPESFLLAKAIGSSDFLTEIKCLNKTMFLSTTGQFIQSGIASVQVPTIEHFAFSTGSPTSVKNKSLITYTKNDFVPLLYAGIKSLTLPELQQFILKTKQLNWKNYPWRQGGMISSVIIAVYLTLTSTWLLFQKHHIEQQLIDQTEQVNEALALQKKYNEQNQWQQILALPLANQSPYWNVWPIVLETISLGVVIQSLQFTNDEFILRGRANESIKATDILANLSKNINIISPSFSTPVRSFRGKDEFTINFTLAIREQLIKPELANKPEIDNALSK